MKDISSITEEILRERAKSKSFITYAELTKEINRRAGERLIPEKGRAMGRILSSVLHEICRRNYRQKGILLGSIVVLKKTGIPSEGYFRFLREEGILKEEDEIEFWKMEVRKVFGNGNYPSGAKRRNKNP